MVWVYFYNCSIPVLIILKINELNIEFNMVRTPSKAEFYWPMIDFLKEIVQNNQDNTYTMLEISWDPDSKILFLLTVSFGRLYSAKKQMLF